MKNIKALFLAVGLVFVSGSAWAVNDIFGSQRAAVWRSTSVCGPVAFGLLSTGSIIVHAVIVDSATLNVVPSQIAIFNSTWTPINGNAGNFISTGILTATGITGSGAMARPPSEYDLWFGSGVVISKQGGACTTVLWDYVLPGTKHLPWSQEWNP